MNILIYDLTHIQVSKRDLGYDIQNLIMYIDLIDKILISENCVRMFGKKITMYITEANLNLNCVVSEV